MCLYVYLVTDSTLPELPWDKRQPSFNVQRLKRKEKFLRNLPGANAYMLGSHEGCGCGFISRDFDDPEERPAETSRLALCEYVEEVMRSEGQLVLFAAWDGDEGKPAVRATLTSRDLFVYPWDQVVDAPHFLEVTLGPSAAASGS